MRALLAFLLFFASFALANESLLFDKVQNFLDNEEKLQLAHKNKEPEAAELATKKRFLLDEVSKLVTSISDKELKALSKEAKTHPSDELKQLELGFYQGIALLRDDFYEGKSLAGIRDDLDKSKLHLQKISPKSEIGKATLLAYLEVFSYLRANASVFATALALKSTGFLQGVEFINSYFSPSTLKSINPGKILVCSSVLLVFWLLRVLILQIIKLILYRSLKQGEASRTTLLRRIKRPLALLLFSYSLHICARLIAYPTPLSVLVNQCFAVAHTIFYAWVVIDILSGYALVFLAKLAAKSERKEVINLGQKVLSSIIVLIAFLVILSQIGFNVSTIIASLGIGGLAVAWATKDIIANFFSSISLLFESSFSQGDWVKIGAVEGLVVETGLRTTTIRTFENTLVFVPNAQILSTSIENFSKRKSGRRIKMYIGIEYGVSVEQIKSLIEDIKSFLENSNLVAKPETDHKNLRGGLVDINNLEGYRSSCYVSLYQFGSSEIVIEVYFYTELTKGIYYRQARSEVMYAIMELIKKNGCAFAFPSHSLYFKDGPKDSG